jgi:hypothetical protein
VFFPDKDMTKLFIKSAVGVSISALNYTPLTPSVETGL